MAASSSKFCKLQGKRTEQKKQKKSPKREKHGENNSGPILIWYIYIYRVRKGHSHETRHTCPCQIGALVLFPLVPAVCEGVFQSPTLWNCASFKVLGILPMMPMTIPLTDSPRLVPRKFARRERSKCPAPKLAMNYVCHGIGIWLVVEISWNIRFQYQLSIWTYDSSLWHLDTSRF